MAAPDSREISPSGSPVNANHAPKFGTLILNRVFVGGIAGSTTEAELHDLFSQYANVKATKIILDRAGVSKGYGFVTFSCETEAKRVLEEPEIMLKDRKLNVAQAIKKQQPFSKPYEATSAASGTMIYPSSVPCTYQNGIAYFPQSIDPNYSGMTHPAGTATYQMVYPQYIVPQQQQQQQYAPMANVSGQALLGSQYARCQYPNYQYTQQQQTYLQAYNGSVYAASNQQQPSNSSSSTQSSNNNNSAITASTIHQNLMPRIHVNQQPYVNGAHSDVSSMINHPTADYVPINAAQQPPCTSMYYQTVAPFPYVPSGIPPDTSHFEQAGVDTSQQCTPNRKKKDFLSPIFQNSNRTPSPNRPSKGHKDGASFNKSIHRLVPKAVNGVTVLTCPKTNDKDIDKSSPLTPPPTPAKVNSHPPPQVSNDVIHKFRHLSV